VTCGVFRCFWWFLVVRYLYLGVSGFGIFGDGWRCFWCGDMFGLGVLLFYGSVCFGLWFRGLYSSVASLGVL